MHPDKKHRHLKASRRWLTKPAISVADGLLIAATVLSANAMKLAWHLPWGIILLIVAGVTAAAMFGIGFVKGLSRTALADYRHWRASRH